MKPTLTEALGAMFVIGIICFSLYGLFFRDSPEVTACKIQGGTPVKVRNAIQTHILPFAADNYHYRCHMPKG